MSTPVGPGTASAVAWSQIPNKPPFSGRQTPRNPLISFSRASCCSLRSYNLSWQAMLEKASRGNQIFLSTARAVSPPTPWLHWVCSTGNRSGSCRPARSLTRESSQGLHTLLSLLCLPQGWARGPWASVKGLQLTFPLLGDGSWGRGKIWALRTWVCLPAPWAAAQAG